MPQTPAPQNITRKSLVLAAYGAALGSVFPVASLFLTNDIAGGLSAAADSAALMNTVQNAASVAGVLAGPIFAAGLGRGRAMALGGGILTLASVMAATAPSLGWMLVARAFLGLAGGVIPLYFMLLVMTGLRPGQGRFEGMASFATATNLLFGLTAILGGALADQFGWRALFWLQAALALPYTIATFTALPGEKGRPDFIAGADWAGFALVSTGAMAVIFALSEGERYFWLEVWWVPALLLGGCVLVVAGLCGMAKERPLLAFSAYRRPTFTLAILLSVFFRFGSLFAILIVPQYLGRLQGLRAAEIGSLLLVMVPATGVGLLLSYLSALRLDARLPLSTGLTCFALAAWMCCGLSALWAAAELQSAAIVAGLGMGLFQVAVLRYAVQGATPVDGPTVGMTFNLARVFGIVGGTALLNHLIVEREKLHSAHLVEALGTTDPETAQRLAGLTANFARFTSDTSAARAAAYAALGRATQAQAFTLAFADALTVTAIILALGAILVWALPGLPPETAPFGATQKAILQ